MGFFALRAGAKSSPRSLTGILKSAHDAAVKAAERDLAERQSAGAPDDGVTVPSAFQARPELDAIKITIKAVPHADYLSCVLRVADAARGMDGENLQSMLTASTELAAAMADFVSLAVASVDGLEDEQGPYVLGGDALSADDVATLAACGLLGDVYAAAKFMQELGPDEKKHCGLPAQPI